MVNYEYLSFFLSFFLILFVDNSTSLSSTSIFYPSFECIIDGLVLNSILPSCTSSTTTCMETSTQANFSSSVSDEYILKSAAYNIKNTKKKKIKRIKGPFLVASTGIYRGKRLKYRNEKYIDQFLGIYYAELPKSLSKPEKKLFVYHLQNATRFSPCCRQSLTMAENLSYGPFVMQYNFDDNCLSLNIYRADLRYGEKRKAIMLFSHGGSNQIGSGSLFDGSILASEGDIIVITMNFRLNYHGFLSSGDDRVRGNYGLWDQLLAIEWIYENAHLFGGDRNRITFAGHSAGAGNVMLIPASPYCRGMIRRIISQSGTGLAPWSINRQPMKLIERFSREFGCERTNQTEMLACVYKLLEKNDTDFYRLHLSLNIADDNPYPVMDNDFLRDTMENILQSDAYQNVDFLTGVTLNEGLYFAEYHIGHFYSSVNKQQQSSSFGKYNNRSGRQKRFFPSHIHPSPIVVGSAPDLVPPLEILVRKEDDEEEIDDDVDEEDFHEKEQTKKSGRRTHVEQLLTYDAQNALEQFANMNYIERYMNANFIHGRCHIDDVKKRYELPGQNNLTTRLRLYIDLVSDLMFNFHMVRCLNLRANVPNPVGSNYVYIYSHRPTFKTRSLFRDQLKTLPNVIGHFAELDSVFGVPLARGYSRIHTNVNMTYYNYSVDEENFSRQLVRYWSNFIKTGDPNRGSLSLDQNASIRWESYTKTAHNYILLKLNHIHMEENYFDSMYNFWLEQFRVDNTGECQNRVRMKKNNFRILLSFLTMSLILSAIILLIFILFRRLQHKKRLGSPTALLPLPSNVSA